MLACFTWKANAAQPLHVFLPTHDRHSSGFDGFACMPAAAFCLQKSLGEGMLSRSSQPAAAAADGSSTSRSHLSHADSQADWADPGSPGAAAK